MAVDLLALSNFKLQLLALVSEIRHLRQGERSAKEDLQCSIQRRKQLEVDHAQKLLELQNQISQHEESERILETKIKFLENERELLEKKEKDSRETITNLLQSRDAFLQHYEDSTGLLNQTIQKKDHKIALLSDKIKSHVLLFDNIQKEAAIVKKAVHNVEDLVNEKEQLVTVLEKKFDIIQSLEKDFVEKILNLEQKLNHHQLELRRKDTAIFELKEQIEVEKAKINFCLEIEELRKALLVKDEIIQRLTSEKQVLHLELGSMEAMLQKMQDLFSSMSTKKPMFSDEQSHEQLERVSKDEKVRAENIIQENKQDSSTNSSSKTDMDNNAAIPQSKVCISANCSLEKHLVTSPLLNVQEASLVKLIGSESSAADEES